MERIYSNNIYTPFLKKSIKRLLFLLIVGIGLTLFIQSSVVSAASSAAGTLEDGAEVNPSLDASVNVVLYAQIETEGPMDFTEFTGEPDEKKIANTSYFDLTTNGTVSVTISGTKPAPENEEGEPLPITYYIYSQEEEEWEGIGNQDDESDYEAMDSFEGGEEQQEYEVPGGIEDIEFNMYGEIVMPDDFYEHPADDYEGKITMTVEAPTG